MYKNLQLLLFHAHLVVCLSSKVTIMDSLTIMWTLVPIKPEHRHDVISCGFSLPVTVQFLVPNCASEMFKHCGCEKLLQNKKANQGWERLLYIYI